MTPDSIESYSYWIQRQLLSAGVDKAVCPHCGNDDPDKMKENMNFTHGSGHHALNYQCHNYATCGKLFKIGPLSDCPCGWNRDEAELQAVLGKRWTYDVGGWGYR